MGLDQFAYFLNETETEKYLGGESVGRDEDFYWRKHPNLQGWMEKLWKSKGGEGEFNCVHVELTRADVEKLEMDIVSNQLPATTGFFYGQSDGSENPYDVTFCQQAKKAIEEGKKVFYSSWW
jgi:hypothetical protein